LPGDIRDESVCQDIVARAVSGLGGLDILVSNAGRQQAHDSILDISTEQFDWTMKTNIYAPFWIIKAALPSMPPGSCIIATTSEQAYDPTPDLYDYAQTKAATMNFVKSLAKQLAKKGIRVNGVAPGPVWTPLQVSGGASPEKLQKFGVPNTFRAARHARRARRNLRAVGRQCGELRYRANLWIFGRRGAALTGNGSKSVSGSDRRSAGIVVSAAVL